MKKILSLLVLGSILGAAPAFAHSSFQHETCRLYLPITQDVSGWGGLREPLIEKGYELIETKVDEIRNLPEDSIYAELSYHSRRVNRMKATCKFSMDLKRITQTNPLQSAMFFSKEVQKSYYAPSHHVCRNVENSVLQELPNCVRK